ncbi:MAG: hypothetical protein M1830_003357 [Pleopsidium flavum]|nr:MAG: hypothetical protein M1830_003357 [Pleopsidium flavum]
MCVKSSVWDDMDFQAESNHFMSWLNEKQGVTISNKIALVDLRTIGAGRGIVATADIEVDEDLFEVPRSIILCGENSDLSKRLPGVLDDLGAWLSLIVVLIYEHLKTPDTLWRPYFRVLPHHFDTLMFWPQAELAELQGSAVVQKIGKDEADKVFREHVVPILQNHPQLFPYPAGVVSYEGLGGQSAVLAMAHTMATLIMAYGFDLEKDEDMQQVDDEGFMSDDDEDDLPKGMVPLADMLNADAEKNNARLLYGKGSLVMRAMTPIKKGKEVLNDYGPLPRSDVLRRYGYITDNYAQYDVVELSAEMIIGVAARSLGMTQVEKDSRLQRHGDKGDLEDSYDLTHPCVSHSAFPRELVLLLGALTSEWQQSALDQVGIKALERRMTPDVAQILQNIIIKKQEEYATTLAQDQALLQDTLVRGRLRMAIQVRLGEKMILKEALEEIGEILVSVPEEANGSTGIRPEKRMAIWDDENLFKKRKA